MHRAANPARAGPSTTAKSKPHLHQVSRIVNDVISSSLSVTARAGCVQVMIAVGTGSNFESEEKDRKDLSLPGMQADLVQFVLENKPADSVTSILVCTTPLVLMHALLSDATTARDGGACACNGVRPRPTCGQHPLVLICRPDCGTCARCGCLASYLCHREMRLLTSRSGLSAPAGGFRFRGRQHCQMSRTLAITPWPDAHTALRRRMVRPLSVCSLSPSLSHATSAVPVWVWAVLFFVLV